MEINLLEPQIQFNGRSGLSRSLGARFTETTFLYTFMALALCSGFFVLMDVFLPLLKLQFKAVLSFGCLFKLVFFIITSYIAWVLRETSNLRVHLHGERLIYEIKETGATTINFADIQSIRIGHNMGVWGLFLNLHSKASLHIPIHLERLDYVLDTLHFHRPDLTQTKEFMHFRSRALALDHVLAHNHSYLPKTHVKAISYFLLYPLYFKHSLERLHADPNKVGRDMSYEKQMESLSRKVNIGLGASIVVLAALMIFL